MSEPDRSDAVDDEQVIRRVLKGQRDEYRHLVRAYQDQVFALILRQVGSRELADELAQDTFVKAFRSLHTFRFESKFSTWLIRIALNHTNSYFSSRRWKERSRTVELDEQRYAAQTSAEAGQEGFSDEAIERLQMAIGRLKAEHREVIVLCGLERKSYEEAALILGVKIGTVRSRLNRARNQLQQIYFEELP